MRRSLAAALAAVTVLGAACSASPADPYSAPAAPSVKNAGGRNGGETPPALTAEESAKVLADFGAGYSTAMRSGDQRDWNTVVTDGLGDAFAAQARIYGRQPGAEPVRLLNPAFYVPRLSGYPRWFAVAALERTARRSDQVLLLFVRKNATDRWRAAHRLAFKGRPPLVDLDEQGYARTAGSPAVSGLAAAHAAYLSTSGTGTGPAALTGGDSGAGTPAGTGPAPTTGTVAFTPDAFTERQRGLAGAAELGGGSGLPGGWSKGADRFEPTGRPAYALRTKDGGALVWYDLRQTKMFTSAGRPTADVLPADLRAYLERTGGPLSSQVTASWIWLAIGYVPARGAATVLGESLYITEATGEL